MTLERAMSINHPSLGLQTLELERNLLWREAAVLSQAKQSARSTTPESPSGASVPASINAVLNSIRIRRDPGFQIGLRTTVALHGS